MRMKSITALLALLVISGSAWANGNGGIKWKPNCQGPGITAPDGTYVGSVSKRVAGEKVTYIVNCRQAGNPSADPGKILIDAGCLTTQEEGALDLAVEQNDSNNYVNVGSAGTDIEEVGTSTT